MAYRFLLLFASVSAFAQLTGPPMSIEECNVWRREQQFAMTLERHDALKFADFIRPDAIFSAGSAEPLRGRDAILKDWAPLLEGKTVKLRWRPQYVNIGGDPGIAVSSGPFVIEDTDAAGKPRYRTGRFSTIWTKRPGGEWLVLYDGSAAPATPVADAKALDEVLSRVPANCQAR